MAPAGCHPLPPGTRRACAQELTRVRRFAESRPAVVWQLLGGGSSPLLGHQATLPTFDFTRQKCIFICLCNLHTHRSVVRTRAARASAHANRHVDPSGAIHQLMAIPRSAKAHLAPGRTPWHSSSTSSGTSRRGGRQAGGSGVPLRQQGSFTTEGASVLDVVLVFCTQDGESTMLHQSRESAWSPCDTVSPPPGRRIISVRLSCL